MAEPAEKKLKVGEAEQPEEKADAEMKAAEAPKVPEPPKEMEADAPASAKPKVKEPIAFLTPDTTLNLLQSEQSNLLMCMNDGGIRHFFAGARANVGVSKGRYMFEVKIVEFVNVPDSKDQKNAVRVGFSTQGSGLVLGSGAENICFDSSGAMLHNDARTAVGTKCIRDSIMTVLLNLDKDSPNFNTISLFKDGKRACQPQPLPDSLKGKALFPHVSFKNATVHVNFGAVPLAPLPFTCRMVQDADKADTSATKLDAPADGKYDVVYPVSLPDEGSFDWLDTFLEKNKSYMELSDRAILNWASQSGIWRPKGHSATSSHDRPDKKFQAPELNDDSVRKAVYSIAPLQGRNYVVMEVKGNLMKDERQALLDRFKTPIFKKVACVVVGEAPAEFKKYSQKLILQQKQEASDKQFQAKKLEEKRKKMMEKKQKELEKAKEKAKKKAEKEKKKKEFEAKKKAAEEKGEKFEEEEPEEEEEEKEEEAEEEKEDDEDPPKAELTAEEKKMAFVKRDTKDLTPVVMSASFTKFTLPTKDEGFDDIKYEWTKGAKCDEYLKKWILDRKLSMRVEDLQPSTWYNQQWAKWQKAFKDWQSKLNEYKTALAKKAAAKAAKEAKKAAAAKKAAEKKEGEEKEEEKKEEPEAMEVEEEKEEETIDFEALDVFGIDDILNVGADTPIFKEFQLEDWAMLQLRFELHILVHAFRKDVNDPERLGIHLDHLAFYYNRYFKKALSPKDYGVETFKEIVDLVNDSVYVTPKSVLESQLDGEMETFAVFAKLTEEARRYRGLRLALGEEGAQLKLSGAAVQGQRQNAPKKQWGNNHSQGGGNWQQNKQQGGGNWQPVGYQQGGGSWQQKQQSYGKAPQQGKDAGKGAVTAPYTPAGKQGGGKAAGKGGWKKY